MLKYSRKRTREEKACILLENSEGGVSLSELARKYQVSPHTLYNWRNAMRKREKEPLDPADRRFAVKKKGLKFFGYRSQNLYQNQL